MPSLRRRTARMRSCHHRRRCRFIAGVRRRRRAAVAARGRALRARSVERASARPVTDPRRPAAARRARVALGVRVRPRAHRRAHPVGVSGTRGRARLAQPVARAVAADSVHAVAARALVGGRTRAPRRELRHARRPGAVVVRRALAVARAGLETRRRSADVRCTCARAAIDADAAPVAGIHRRRRAVRAACRRALRPRSPLLAGSRAVADARRPAARCRLRRTLVRRVAAVADRTTLAVEARASQRSSARLAFTATRAVAAHPVHAEAARALPRSLAACAVAQLRLARARHHVAVVPRRTVRIRPAARFAYSALTAAERRAIHRPSVGARARAIAGLRSRLHRVRARR